MKVADKKRFVSFFVACAEVYGREVGEGALGIWWEALRAYSVEEVEEAFGRHLRSPDVGQFMPKPADVLRMLEGTSVDAAQVAWAKVDKGLRSIGPYASVCFDDPLAQRCVHDMGGWIALSTKSSEEWPFVANEFRTRYTGYRSRGESPEYPPRLIGITEADNIRRGFPPGDLVLIGDEERARFVSERGTTRELLGFHRMPALGSGLGSKVRQLTGPRQ